MVSLVACSPGGDGGEGASPATAPRGTVAPTTADTLRSSDRGLYRVSLRPEAGEAPLQRLHAWVARVADREGDPVVPTRLVLDGGMPQHGHGMSTRPRVTGAVGPGAFRIEGVRFHMSGRWVLALEILGPEGADSFRVSVDIEP